MGVLSCVVAVALCSPDADAFHGYGGFGLGVAAHPFGRSFIGSTVYGYSPFRYGKRSADADAFYGKRSAEVETAPEVSGYGKRSAEPHGVVGHVHGLGLGVAGHPGYATSYVGRTVYGYPSLGYGKRSADADAHYRAYGYGRYSYGSPYGYGYRRGYFYG